MHYAGCTLHMLILKIRKGKYDIYLIYHNLLMENFIYALIFITGTFFGSFFTLAVYRIPKREDILIKHSYCPNCNHRLGFFDLFPVLSYIFLNGKCRYCGNIIRPRYLILELLSGLTFLIMAIGLKINVFNLNSIINVVFLLIYISILFIIAGIDKENIKIEKSVMLFGFIFELLYIIYQYTVCELNVYQYVIYMILFIISLIIINILTKKSNNKEYTIQVLCLSLYVLIFNGHIIWILTLLFTLIIALIYKIFCKVKLENIPIGLYITITNIIVITISNIITNYII